MSVLNPKIRLVSFRLSEEEYSDLCALCSAQRARSISDFVRDNMHSLLAHTDAGTYLLPPHSPSLPELPTRADLAALTGLLADLHRRTDALDRQVHHLTQLIHSADLSRKTGTKLPDEGD